MKNSVHVNQYHDQLDYKQGRETPTILLCAFSIVVVKSLAENDLEPMGVLEETLSKSNTVMVASVSLSGLYSSTLKLTIKDEDDTLMIW